MSKEKKRQNDAFDFPFWKITVFQIVSTWLLNQLLWKSKSYLKRIIALFGVIYNSVPLVCNISVFLFNGSEYCLESSFAARNNSSDSVNYQLNNQLIYNWHASQVTEVSCAILLVESVLWVLLKFISRSQCTSVRSITLLAWARCKVIRSSVEVSHF